MNASDLEQFIVYQWAIAKDAPLLFLVAIVLGFIAGYLSAWTILRNRLKRHGELIAYFKAALANTTQKSLSP